jgi:hypothetical protein
MRQVLHKLGLFFFTIAILLAFLMFLNQCHLPLQEETPLGFSEVAEACGITHFYNHKRGAGIAIFDFNNDYLEDIIFAHPTANKLYKNNGDGTFTEMAKKAKLIQSDGIKCIGVVTGDFNNDGFDDVFFSSEKDDPFLLFMNLGNGSFRDVSIESGLNEFNTPRHKTASLGDVNLDGYLDIYIGVVVQHRKDKKKPEDEQSLEKVEIECAPDLLFINDGKMHFDEISHAYQAVNMGCGFSPVFTDPDNDGDLDLLIPNDWGKENLPSRFFRNEYPEKQFTDMSEASGFDHAVYGMGLAIGDYDQDGDLDYYETNIGPNKFFENLGSGKFKECAREKGIEDQWMDPNQKKYLNAGWGTHFIDFDNDSYLDLVVGNSKQRGFESLEGNYLGGEMLDSMPSKLFRNTGKETFLDITEEVGLLEHNNAMSTITFDYDNDGDVDIIFGNTKHEEDHQGEPSFFSNNLSNTNNWLRIKLVGTT